MERYLAVIQVRATRLNVILHGSVSKCSRSRRPPLRSWLPLARIEVPSNCPDIEVLWTGELLGPVT